MSSSLILVLFVALTLVVGLVPFFRQKRKSGDVSSKKEYFLGGGQLGLIVLFFTTMATWNGSSMLLGAVAEVYATGIGWGFAFTSTTIAALVFFFLAPYVRRASADKGYATHGDLLEDRYKSKALKLIAGIVGVFCMIPYLTIQVVGTGLILEQFSGGAISYWLGSLLGVIVCGTFVFFGGLRSVAVTDVFLGVVFLLGGWITVTSIVYSVYGDYGTFLSAAVTDAPEMFTLPAPNGVSWGHFFSLAWIVGLGGYMWPQNFLRMVACDSDKTARKVGALVSFAVIPAHLPVFIGAILALLLLPNINVADTALLQLINVFGSPWMISVLGLGAVAASLSTANSLVHSLGTLISEDVFAVFDAKISEKKTVAITRTFVVVTCIVAYLFSLTKPTFLWTILSNSYVGIAQFFPVLCAALFYKRSTKAGVIAGFVLGCLSSLILVLADIAPFGLYGTFWGIIINSITIFIVSQLTAPKMLVTHKLSGSHRIPRRGAYETDRVATGDS